MKKNPKPRTTARMRAEPEQPWRAMLDADPHFVKVIEGMEVKNVRALVTCLTHIHAAAQVCMPIDPQEIADDLRNPDTASAHLERAAQLVTDDEARVLRGIAARYGVPEMLNPENLSTRGGAASSFEGAWRGWLVRELVQHIPQKIENRDATIANLLCLAGLKVTRQYIRSILRKGH